MIPAKPILTLAAALLFATAARAQSVSVNLYGDVDYIGFKLFPPGGAPSTYSSTFSVPRVATLFTGTLGRLALINEITFTVPIYAQDNSFNFDVERFEVSYQVAEWLRLKAGRFHTAFGYYNDAYHSNFYYQLGADRPGFTRFEEDGGLIPARAIGVHADGRIRIGAAGALHYDVEVANGRGDTLAEILNRQDLNKGKAVNFRLRYEPAFLEGLVIGANYYFDDIPGSTQVVGVNPNTGAPIGASIPNLHEQIIAAHVAYAEGRLHLIAEIAHFIHAVRDSDVTFTTDAGFVEAGYTFGDFTPFVVFDKIVLPGGANGAGADPYFGLSVAGGFGSTTSVSAGVRWQVVDGLALKLQAGHLNAAFGTVESVLSQVAVAF